MPLRSMENHKFINASTLSEVFIGRIKFEQEDLTQ